MAIEPTLLESDPLRFKKNYFILLKMTVPDQLKNLDRKIKQNEAQFDLDRKASKTSALSSNKSDKYEYLTGANLDLKSSTVEQKTFEYSP